MAYETLAVDKQRDSVTLTIARPSRQNSIDAVLIDELSDALDEAEKSPDCRLVILAGQNGIFCTGMDFQEVEKIFDDFQNAGQTWQPEKYMAVLKRFTLSPKIIIAKIDGKVTAGGLGLVAASDLAVATSRTTFCLSEALWGLLPANILPFLIRRVGFQKAYSMTLTTRTVSAEEACSFHLVDDVCENPDDYIRRLSLRLNRLAEETIRDMKTYFRKMWIVTEEMEAVAVEEITRLMQQPRVQKNIRNFIERQIFPWENRVAPQEQSRE